MGTMNNRCFVRSMALVSCQKPLSDEWLENPCLIESGYVRSQEPDSSKFIKPSEARRMSKILKRAICTSLTALDAAGISNPDAIITGTGMGCMENTEKFLADMATFGESCLKPTLFMQSTHNTIGSLIGIMLKCHGYNTTYSHGGISFESALLDAFVQLRLGAIRNALIGSHDENTPLTARLTEWIHPEYRTLTETAMSSVITTDFRDAICEIADVKILHRTSAAEVSALIDSGKDTLLMLGVNGNEINDAPYSELLAALDHKPVCLRYRNIFGDNLSSSAAGFYAAVRILEHQSIPAYMSLNDDGMHMSGISGITIINSSEDSTWTVTRLKAI